MKKILVFLSVIFLSFVVTACETTLEISAVTNLTQEETTTTDNYVAVTWIGISADYQEVCLREQINLTVEVLPTNATNQNYTITIDTNYLNFVNSNQLLLVVVDEDPNGISTTVTITSDDNTSITDTLDVYIMYNTDSSCPTH